MPGHERLEIRDVASADRHVLVLSGHLDLATTPDLDDAIRRVCGTGCPEIVLDLSALTFVDSTGLYSVLNANRLCEEQHFDFFVRPGMGAAARLFEICGLTEVAPFLRPPGAPA